MTAMATVTVTQKRGDDDNDRTEKGGPTKDFPLHKFLQIYAYTRVPIACPVSMAGRSLSRAQGVLA